MPRGQKKYTTEQWVTERIKYYWERKKNYEATKENFEQDKHEFNVDMDKYFDNVADDDGKFTIDVSSMARNISKITCQRISQVKVNFDIYKLRKCLTKKQQKQVIQKHYNVINWPNLLQLMKDAGVDHEEFMKCVEVTESVRENVLNQLVELGEADYDEVKKCSSVNIKTQYYKITEK